MQNTAGKKHQIFEKWDDFENRPSCKGNSPCKGYSLCKMVNLGQKLKWPKTCAKRLYKKTRVVLCKKPLEKTPNIRERRFWKSAILQRLLPTERLYPLKNVQFGSKIKTAKNMRKTVVQEDYSSSVQKTAGKKHQIFEKWDDFKNRPSCKGYSPCKSYTLWKNGQFGSKIKTAKNMRKTIVEED